MVEEAADLGGKDESLAGQVLNIHAADSAAYGHCYAAAPGGVCGVEWEIPDDEGSHRRLREVSQDMVEAR